MQHVSAMQLPSVDVNPTPTAEAEDICVSLGAGPLFLHTIFLRERREGGGEPSACGLGSVVGLRRPLVVVGWTSTLVNLWMGLGAWALVSGPRVECVLRPFYFVALGSSWSLNHFLHGGSRFEFGHSTILLGSSRVAFDQSFMLLGSSWVDFVIRAPCASSLGEQGAAAYGLGTCTYKWHTCPGSDHLGGGRVRGERREGERRGEGRSGHGR